MQEKVYQTHIANIDELKVETSASSGVGGAGPQTYRCSYRTAATRSQCVWLVCESSGGDILTNICVEFTRSPLGYLLNSWPM